MLMISIYNFQCFTHIVKLDISLVFFLSQVVTAYINRPELFHLFERIFRKKYLVIVKRRLSKAEHLDVTKVSSYIHYYYYTSVYYTSSCCSYKSMYCALCHGVLTRNIRYWKAVQDCPWEIDEMDDNHWLV